MKTAEQTESIKLKNESLQRIKKMFPGYETEYQGIEERYNEQYIKLKLYLDNEQGTRQVGNFYLPNCNNCVDELDVVLYILDEFPKVHPELFTRN